MKNLNVLLAISFVWLCCYSCSQKAEIPDEDILSKDMMVTLLTDIHLAEGYAQEMRLSAEKMRKQLNRDYSLILKTHKIDSAIFIKSYNYYSQNVFHLDEIYKMVIDELMLKEAEILQMQGQ
mgnify:CR=1 FL=1